VSPTSPVGVAEPALAEQRTGPSPRSDRVQRWVVRFPWSIAVVVAVLVMGTIKLARTLGQPFTSGGDAGFLEIQIRQALHGAVTLGPYSRYGWHHPGPAVFYLFAPVYWLSGESSRSLFLDSWLLNAGCVLVAVLIVRHFVGERAARVAAGALVVYVAAAGFAALINPWNPSWLALPVLVVLAATAGACCGSGWSLLALFVAGSFAVQTHIGTAPICGVALVIGVVGYVWAIRHTRREGDGAGGRRFSPALVVTSVVAVVVLWGAPVAEELAHGHANGNLSALWHFYLHPPAADGPTSHSLRHALSAVSDYATVVPLGAPADLKAHAGRLILSALFVVLGVLGAVGWWRRARFLAWFSMMTPIGLAVATVAATRVVGPYEDYLFFWCETLALPAVVATVAYALDFAQSRLRYRDFVDGAITLLGLVVVTSVTVGVIAQADVISYQDSPDARAAAAVIESNVASKDQVFTLDVVEQEFSDGPLVLTLVKDGYQFRLDPAMDLYSGNTTRPADGPTFEVEASGPPTPEKLPGRHLVTVGALDVWEKTP
jgi:hypothetical protein